MNSQEFMNEVYNSYRRSVKVLIVKEKEYAEGGDRLIQFHRVAKRQGCNPCEALIGMTAKHYDSVEHMVQDPHVFSLDTWNEKLTDLRNYTFLLDALLRDMGVK